MSEFLNENVLVEDAPESVSLEELLGLTDIDLGETKTKKVFEVSEKDDIDVDEPHIKIPTKRVGEMLSVSSMVSAAGENSFEGKVIALKVFNGNAKFLLSDNKRTIERTVPLLNTENFFEGFLVFSSSMILRLLKVCTSICTIVERTVKDEISGKDKKKYILKIRGGEISLDAINIPENKFTFDYDSVSKKEYDKEPILNSIKKLYNFASTSIRSGKSIDFDGNTISTSPINSIAKVRVDNSLPSFKLSLIDCKILHTLSGIDDGDKISISSDGKVFSGNTFNFKTESYPVSSNSSFSDVADRMFSGDSCIVDEVHLSQITELSCALDTSTGNLRFNYNDDGLVVCKLLTKRENSDIVIQGDKNENVSPMSSDVEVSAYSLKGGLTVFNGNATLCMRVSSDGTSFESGNTKLAVLGKVVLAK